MQQFDVKGTGAPAPAARTALGDEAPAEVPLATPNEAPTDAPLPPASKAYYKPHYKKGSRSAGFSETAVSSARNRLISSGGLFLVLLYLNTPFLPAALCPSNGIPLNALVQLALVLPVYALNHAIFLRGIEELRSKCPGTQALMALSGGAALLHGLVGIAAAIAGDAAYIENLYFVYAAAVFTFAAAGAYIQARSGVSFAAKSGVDNSAAPFASAWDKLLAAYTAAALGVAGVTLIVWLLAGRGLPFALARALAVLAVACPCVLGAVLPVAVLLGRKAGEKAGVLFCTAAGMEALGNAVTIVLGKADVILPGVPAVAEIIGTRNVPAKFLLGMAAGLESRNANPIAQAILQRAAAEGITVRPAANLTVSPGRGLQGTFTGKVMVGGTAEYVSAFCALPAPLTEAGATLLQQGVTPLYFALDGHAAGLVGISDVVKADCKPAVAQLKGLGLQAVLFTADAAATAEYTGGLAGIDREQVFSALSPADAPAEVSRLQKGGGVIVIGGGAEAAALARAACGVARHCAGPAPDTADVLLLRDDLTCLPAAVQLSRNLTRAIRTRLFPVLLLGMVCLLLAAGVLYPLGFLLTPGLALAAALLALIGTAACLIQPLKPTAPEADRKPPQQES